MTFYGGVQSSTRKNWLNIGGDLGIVRWVNEQKKPPKIVVANPDRGVGNDPELFFFFFFLKLGSLSQPRLNIFTVGNIYESNDLPRPRRSVLSECFLLVIAITLCLLHSTKLVPLSHVITSLDISSFSSWFSFDISLRHLTFYICSQSNFMGHFHMTFIRLHGILCLMPARCIDDYQ